MKFRHFVFALTILFASPAYATLTVYDLKHLCISTKDQDQVGCRLYILGVADGVDLESRLAGKLHFCVPPGIQTIQLERVVTRAINEDVVVHPQDNKMPAVSFIGAVFSRLFPCQQSVSIPGSANPAFKNYPGLSQDPASQGGYVSPKSLTEGYELAQPPGATAPDSGSDSGSK